MMFDRKAYMKEWRKNNPEYHRKYWFTHKKEWKEYCRKFYLKHKEERDEYIAEWRKDNVDKIKKSYKEWVKTEEGKACRQRIHFKRKAKEIECINTLTAREWIDILKQYKFKCAYCGKEFTLFDKATKDHVIPISKGGDNIKENIVPACKSCNSKKHDKLLKGDIMGNKEMKGVYINARQ